MTEKLKNKVVEYLFGHRSNSAKRNTKQTANDGNKKQLANNTIKKMEINSTDSTQLFEVMESGSFLNYKLEYLCLVKQQPTNEQYFGQFR